ncbi:MAG: hypothetical protein WC231_00420 [Dehalococcoidales bacterium]|jgi:hypothetical protein
MLLGKMTQDYGPLFYPVLVFPPVAGILYYREAGVFVHVLPPDLVLLVDHFV